VRATTTLVSVLFSSCAVDDVRVAHPPAAFAGFDLAVELGGSALLDGTRSTDPDGDRLSYSWRLEARPIESLAELEGARSPLAVLTPDVLGGYVAGLTVTDGDFVRRDLIAVTAIDAAATSTAPLSLALAPRACNADLERLQDAPCGVSDRRVAIDPVMLAYPVSLLDRLTIEWTFIRLPLGADVSELSAGTPRGPLGEITFVPPRPGEYWLSARLIGPSRTSAPAVASVGVFDEPPPADVRPLPSIEAPTSARMGQIVLFDSRDSYVPTSSTGVRPRRIWSLVSDPSGGEDELTDIATGCPVDECRRLIPSERGQYLVSLAIGAGVTAIASVEVE
jgi:hypothetical protein